MAPQPMPRLDLFLSFPAERKETAAKERMRYCVAAGTSIVKPLDWGKRRTRIVETRRHYKNHLR